MENKQKRRRGRPNGFTVPEETRQQISKNNAWRSPVITPAGEFHSLSEAARYYKVTPMSISNRCKLGAKQRELGHDNTTSNVRDYRGWIMTPLVRNNVAPRAVRVPWGEFPSLTSAAKANNTSVSTLRLYIKNGRDGYEYL